MEAKSTLVKIKRRKVQTLQLSVLKILWLSVVALGSLVAANMVFWHGLYIRARCPFSAISYRVRDQFYSGHIAEVKNASDLRRVQENVTILNHPDFPRALNRSQHATMISFMSHVHDAMEAYRIPYMMSFGTLLGSYMTHNTLPWDDDLDIIINLEDFAKLQKVNEDLSRKFGLRLLVYTWCYVNATSPMITHNNNHTMCQSLKAKLYDVTSDVKTEYPWRWPFVDILSYSFNETYAWVNNEKSVHVVHTKDLFPIVSRPFDRLMLPAPKNPLAVVSTWYQNMDKFECATHFWNHVTEQRRKQNIIRCVDLASHYPFVRRAEHRLGVRETLCIKQHCFYTMVIGHPFVPGRQNQPYHLKYH